jgi:hypothetical protein
VGYINWNGIGEENTPVRSDNSIPQRIHALGLRLMLYFRDAGSVLLFLELASHLCGLGVRGRLWRLWVSWVLRISICSRIDIFCMALQGFIVIIT